MPDPVAKEVADTGVVAGALPMMNGFSRSHPALSAATTAPTAAALTMDATRELPSLVNRHGYCGDGVTSDGRTFMPGVLSSPLGRPVAWLQRRRRVDVADHNAGSGILLVHNWQGWRRRTREKRRGRLRCLLLSLRWLGWPCGIQRLLRCAWSRCRYYRQTELVGHRHSVRRWRRGRCRRALLSHRFSSASDSQNGGHRSGCGCS